MDPKHRKIYLVLGFCLALAFIIGFFFLSKSYISNDEGSYIYEPAQVLLGKIPFKDFISRAPIEIYLFAIIFKIFGSSVLVIKIINATLAACIGLMVYLIVGQHRKKSIAIVATLLTLVNSSFILPAMVVNTTNLSILLILLSCYTLKRNSTLTNILTGAFLAMAVFTREINAIFVLSLLIYFIATKNRKKLIEVVFGGIIVSTIVIGYFANYIGLLPAISMTLGIGHLGVDEEKLVVSYSLSILTFFSLTLLPILGYFLILKKDNKKYALVYPEIIWILVTALFYVYYFTKRGFMLSYGAEFIPLIIIVVFVVCEFKTEWYYQKNKYALILPCLILLSAFPFVWVRPEVPMPVNSFRYGGFNLNRLIGGGIPSNEFDKINNTIKNYTKPGDIILTGNLAFITENNLNQFMNLSRPMAYSGDSTVYELYNAPTPQEILNNFQKNPTKVVIKDRHLSMSLWPELQNFILWNYFVRYADDYAVIFVLRPENIRAKIK